MNGEHPKDMKSSAFLYVFRQMSVSISHYIHLAALKHDLSVIQYSLLMAIAPQRALTQKQLGDLVQIPKSTLSQVVDSLVRAGWIDRAPVKDNRREMQLTMTPRGFTLFESITKQHGSILQVMDEVFNALPEKKYQDLQSTLQIITDSLEQESSKKEQQTHD